MVYRVRCFLDPASFMQAAGLFLRSSPVENNLILTVLEESRTPPSGTLFWAVSPLASSDVTGVAFQSLHASPTLSAMPCEASQTLADFIFDSGATLRGISGEAGAAAAFAGRWVERSRRAARPTQSFRLCELLQPTAVQSYDGRLRRATPEDCELAADWFASFQVERSMPRSASRKTVERWIDGQQLWFWACGQPCAMATARPAVSGVTRLSAVFTPPGQRRKGYATALVDTLSRQLSLSGLRCVLYVDLDNPAAVAIYRRLGYQAIVEATHYSFSDAPPAGLAG